MMQSWLVLSLAALLIWGCWGLFANLTAQNIGGYSALVWEVIGAMIVGGAILLWLLRAEGGLEISAKGAGFGVATGITYTIGLTFLFLALNQAGGKSPEGTGGGSVHTILILTALYPVIAVGLNYFVLDEPLSLRQLIGMAIGLTGIAILVTN